MGAGLVQRDRGAMPLGSERRLLAGERRTLLAGLAVFGLFAVAWFVAARSSPQLLDRDWTAFDRAGSRAWRGDWREVYRASLDEPSPFLYPPFAIWLTLPLGLLGRYASYLLCAGGGLAALAASAWQVARLDHVRRAGVAAVAGATLGSASLMLTLVTGQASPLYVLAIVTALVADHRGRPMAAGLALSALLLKPNLAIFFVAYLLWRRARPAIVGFVTGAAIVVASMAPFGVGPWRGFVEALRWVAHNEGHTTVANAQVTLLSLLRTVLHHGTAGRAATLLWLAASLVVVATVAGLWRRGPALAGAVPLRWWGTIVLLAVALNVRLYFYDALILVVPAAGWYLERGSYSSRRRWWACGLAVAGCSLTLYPVMVDRPTGVAVGGFATVWLLIETVDLARTRARR
jgi:hypothetical protein